MSVRGVLLDRNFYWKKGYCIIHGHVCFPSDCYYFSYPRPFARVRVRDFPSLFGFFFLYTYIHIYIISLSLFSLVIKLVYNIMYIYI